jgi:hypothetical protein
VSRQAWSSQIPSFLAVQARQSAGYEGTDIPPGHAGEREPVLTVGSGQGMVIELFGSQGHDPKAKPGTAASSQLPD